MKKIAALISSFLLIALSVNPVFACGPSYVSPIFEYRHAPENPYANFAAGKIGILKPTQRRIVLIAAYRYLSGGGFSDAEQKALVEVWNAEFNNKPYADDGDTGETVKKWVEKRKAVVGKEEKTPEIYTERGYGGYDFFPNCTKNAFETATETLAARTASHGSNSGHVKDWIAAQDKVFANCASGRSIPDAPADSMPEWLRKDRAYQIAAAEFYSLDYDSAKRRFAQIAQDFDSPWQATAEYLVGRTLVRQASLTKDAARSSMLYAEAEQHLSVVAIKGNQFSDSASKMLGLIKYRLRPEERVRELAQIIAVQGGANFRQDLIDYNWLLDKFEKQTLEREEKRKKAEAVQMESDSPVSLPVPTPQIPDPSPDTNRNPGATPTPGIPDPNVLIEQMARSGQLKIVIYSEDYAQNWTIYVNPEATDEEVFAEAEKAVGRALTDKMKEQVRSGKINAYRERFEGNKAEEYEGGYWGTEKMSPSNLPEFLRADEMTNWLFTFQMESSGAYDYALAQYRQTNSDLWLLTALAKADKTSAELARLFEAASKIDRNSVAYPTIAYHKARILIAQGKTAEARKMLDEILESNADLPVSTRNRFLIQRAGLSETLDDYLRFVQLKPFAFDWDGRSGTIEEFIAIEKSWYTPESNPNQTREEYDRQVEENFKHERLWENRSLFDAATIEAMNQHFPLALLLETEKSPVLPDYLRERFALTIWTRAVLLEDFALAERIAPEVVRFHPELQALMEKIGLAKTVPAKQRAAIYLILKNPMFTPYLEDGLGKADNEFGLWDGNDWWCAPYDTEYDDALQKDVPKQLPAKPAFLTGEQTSAAQAERKKLREIGDAPKYLGEKLLEWARLAPTDKRVPELLFIVWEANGWTKYGCGSNVELRREIGNVLKRKYPQSEWTQKLLNEEKAEN